MPVIEKKTICEHPVTEEQQLKVKATPVLTFILLLTSEMFRIRLEWFWYLIQMSFVPLSYLAFVYFLWEDPRAAQYAVTGSLVVTMSTSAMLSLGQHIGWMKTTSAYEHYAALPVSKGAFVAALATRGVLLSLPSIMTVIIIGYLTLGIRVTTLGLVVLILGAYAMSGLGTFIGFWSRDARVSSLATQVLATIIIFLAPVYVPLERLPLILKITSTLIPTTYVARGLRLAVAGCTLQDVWLDLTVLAALAVVSLFLVPLRVAWRQN